MKPRITGRGWAYVGALLGGAVSVAANVAHSYVPPAGAAPDWAPQTGAVVGAVFWPVALFVVVEIFARVAWPAGWRWTLLRFAGLLPVALVAAVVSYRHLSGLLAFYNEDHLTATIGPLAVDGLMVMATGALIATGARRTLAATVEHTAPAPGPAPVPTDAPAAVAPAKPAAKATRPHVARRPASADKVAKAAARMPGATVAAIAAKAGVSETTARRQLARLAEAADDAAVPPATPAAPAATPALANAA